MKGWIIHLLQFDSRDSPRTYNKVTWLKGLWEEKKYLVYAKLTRSTVMIRCVTCTNKGEHMRLCEKVHMVSFADVQLENIVILDI